MFAQGGASVANLPPKLSLINVVPAKQFVVSAGISKTSYGEVVELCRRWIGARASDGNAGARYICVTSAHGIILAKDDPSFAEVLNSADIATPDGMPVVWALRSFGAGGQQRVYGPTLMLESAEARLSMGIVSTFMAATTLFCRRSRPGFASAFPACEL